MKKFTEIPLIDFEIDNNILPDDIVQMDDEMLKFAEKNRLEGEWEIVSVIDVTAVKPDINEAIIINAELGSNVVKRGDYLYVTALIHKKDSSPYHQQQMGVLKVRVTDIYNNLFILNSLK